MSRKGDCWDNAVTEGFFATLKTELIHRQPWPTRRRAKDAVAEYIEGFYNPYRFHSSLGYVSPNDYERKQARQAESAAYLTCPLFPGKISSRGQTAVAIREVSTPR